MRSLASRSFGKELPVLRVCLAAKGFLQYQVAASHQIRMMVGALIQAANLEIAEAQFDSLLASPLEADTFDRHRAPANGLTLVEIRFREGALFGEPKPFPVGRDTPSATPPEEPEDD